MRAKDIRCLAIKIQNVGFCFNNDYLLMVVILTFSKFNFYILMGINYFERFNCKFLHNSCDIKCVTASGIYHLYCSASALHGSLKIYNSFCSLETRPECRFVSGEMVKIARFAQCWQR